MARTFSESDFADSAPAGRRTFSEQDFSPEEAGHKPAYSGPAPSGLERFAAGFGQRDIQQPPGFDAGDILEFVGREGLPTVGGIVGGAGGAVGGFGVGAIPGAAIGAAAGRSAQKAIGQAINFFKPGFAKQETPRELISDVGVTGATQGIFEGLATGGRIAAQALRPGAIRAGAQALKTTTGVMEDIGKQALNDPGILFRAKSLQEAGKAIEEVTNRAGVKTNTAGLKEAFGKRFFKSGDEFLDDIGNKIDEKLVDKSLTLQEAVSARQAINRALMAPKYQSPINAMNKAEALDMLGQLDDFIEPKIPGYSEARKGYREAIVKDSFNSLLPQNANKTASVLRGTLALGGAEYGRRTDSPAIQAASLAMFSPLLVGGGIRAAYAGSRALTGAAATQLPDFFARGAANQLAPSISEYYMRGR